MKNLSILGKLLVAALPIVIVSLIGLFVMSNEVDTALEESEVIFYEQLYSADDIVVTADRDFYQSYAAELLYMSAGDYSTQEQLDSYKADAEENGQQVRDGVAALIDIIAKYPALGTYEYNGYTLNACIEQFGVDIEAWDSWEFGDRENDAYGTHRANFENARASLNEMGDILENYAIEEKKDLTNEINTRQNLTMVIVIAIFIVALLFAFYVIRYIRKNLKYISGKIESIAHNDLTDTIEPLNNKDEIGGLNAAARDVQTHLKEMIATLQGSSLSLANSSREMGNSTNETSESVSHINSAAGDLATTATSQASDIADIANHMSTVDEMMQKNTENANALAEVSNQIRGVTDEGLKRVDGLKSITEQSVEAFEEIFEVINSIEASTKKISEASDLISSIAGQTNLLSLNASIEAARAGDAGRGFAVVAEEIRQLSEQSAESVNIINQMLADLQHNTDNAARQSDNVREYVNRQKEAVEETSSSFGDIAGGIQTINATVDELHSANQSLNDGISNISGLIESLSAISEENAATAEELNATTDTVNSSVEILAENGNSVSKSADDLEKIIGEFIV